MNGLNLNVQRQCISFLSAYDLVTLRLTSKVYFDEICVMEWAWQQLCERRWRDIRNSKRIANVNSWRLTYQTLSRNRCMPRGILTEPHCAILGIGKGHRSQSWLLLGHTTDCRPRYRPHSNTSKFTKYVEVHLCIQNVDITSSMAIQLSKHETIVIHRYTENMMLESMECWNPRIVAYNGFKIVNTSTHSNINLYEQSAKLNCYDFVVLSFDVGVSDDIGNEMDFLVQLANVSISYSRCYQHHSRDDRASRIAAIAPGILLLIVIMKN